MIVAIDKRYPGHARKTMHAIWGTGQMMFTKTIVVVDRDVDVRGGEELLWKALASIDPERDVEIVRGPVDELDFASRPARATGARWASTRPASGRKRDSSGAGPTRSS